MPDDKEPESRRVSSPGRNSDYYALLGLPERYDVDCAALEVSYLARSKEVHPDRFVTAPASERVSALERSMELNDAYKTLIRPVARAEYLLARRGIVIGDNEALDHAFLEEVLALREELADARRRGDTSALGKLEDAMLDRQDAILEELGRAFAELEQTGDSTLLDAIKRHVIHLRYVARYLQQFEDDLDASGPGVPG